MNSFVLKTRITIVVVFWINTAICQPQTYSIIGNMPKSTNIDKMMIYRYHNMFDQEDIGVIEVNNGRFEFKYSLDEEDAYMIKSLKDGHFFIFIWDNNIEIKVDSIEFSNSTVLYSPLTTELDSFHINLEKQVFSEVRDIEKLISITGKKEPKVQSELVNLERLKSKAMALAIERHRDFYLSYINNHLDSFVSLYLLTIMGGMQFELNYPSFFQKFSERLKKHSRAKVFLEK